MAERAGPVPTPDTLPYWEAANRGELRLPRCRSCDELIFYPRPFCPRCLGDDLEWETLSGRATLHSYVISYRPPPGWEDQVPYVIAIVRLDEGPTMMSNVVGVEPTPEALPIDLALEVAFEARGNQQVPVFRPAGTRA
jgi:uncharacterized OB-fold protein